MNIRPFKYLLFFAILLSSFSLFAQGGGEKEKMEEDILYYVNKHREGIGLPILKMNDDITQAANAHSRDMASKKIPFGHDGFDERMGRLLKLLKPANAAAENVAEGSKSAKDVVELWLHSSGHRKNIEGNYNTTGIGIATAEDGTLYFTQIFINRR